MLTFHDHEWNHLTKMPSKALIAFISLQARYERGCFISPMNNSSPLTAVTCFPQRQNEKKRTDLRHSKQEGCLRKRTKGEGSEEIPLNMSLAFLEKAAICLMIQFPHSSFSHFHEIKKLIAARNNSGLERLSQFET